jgi:anti-sigma regulatory factor (Ser/Thr protein kinase)
MTPGCWRPAGLPPVGLGSPVYRLHDGDAHGRDSRCIGGRDNGQGLVAASGWRSPGHVSAWLAVPPEAMPFTYTTDLSEVRARVRSHARQAGLPETRANDLVLAVSEVAANTLRHARSAGTLTIWHDDSEIVCEIRDSGIITDPLVGQRRPPADALAGHGLWLVHQLCDQVELTSGDGGTTIRMHMTIRLDGAGR